MSEIALPLGATAGDDWTDDDGRRYRVIAGQDRRVAGVDGIIGTSAVQRDDGSIDLSKLDGPTVWVGLAGEGIPTASARKLAYAILAAADEADGWVEGAELTGSAATRVVLAMAARRVAPADLAAHLGISEGALERRLTSRTSFTIAELFRVGEYLDCTLSDLLAVADEIEGMTL